MNGLTFGLAAGMAFVVLLPLSAADEPTATATVDATEWVFLENDQLRVGLLRSHGGAIGHLSLQGSRDNLLNHYDHGRLVQQSYYGDEDRSKWAEKPWRYNPVQGGDYRGSASRVDQFKSTGTTAYARTTPRHWATGELLKECVMEQWVELHGPLVHARYRFTYSGSHAHGPRHQETPAVFVAPRLKTLVTYVGEKPWSGGALTRRAPGWPNESVRLDENWAAWLDDDGNGVGIYVPGAPEGTCYRYRGGDGSDCSYVAPLRTFAIKPGLDFSYRAFLTAGDVATIRERFRSIYEAKK